MSRVTSRCYVRQQSGNIRHVTTAPVSWADRFRAARKAAGFTSSEKLAKTIGASRRAALRWETGESVPRAYKDQLAAISPEFQELMAELPAEEHLRYDLAGRVEDLTDRLEALEASVGSLLTAVSGNDYRLELLEQRTAAGAVPQRTEAHRPVPE